MNLSKSAVIILTNLLGRNWGMKITVARDVFENAQQKIDIEHGLLPTQTHRRLKNGNFDVFVLLEALKKIYQKQDIILNIDNSRKLHHKIKRFLASDRSELELDTDQGFQSRKRQRTSTNTFACSDQDQQEELEYLKNKLRVKDHLLAQKDDAIESMNQIMTRLTDENIQLKNQNSSLEKTLGEFKNFFKRSEFNSQGGGWGKPSAKCNQFIMRMLVESIPAPQIHFTLKTMAEGFPNVFTNALIPSESYIKNMRSLMPDLHKKQLAKFIQESSWLSLSHDSSPNTNMMNYLAIMLTNSENKFILVGMALCEDHTAKTNCKVAFQILREQLDESLFREALRKISFLCSDRAASALLANSLIIKEMENIVPSDSGRFYASCHLHLAMHLEGIMIKHAGSQLDELLVDISILFGTRKQGGFSQESLAHDLHIFLPDITFHSIRGSRVYSNIFNLRQLVINYDKILHILHANDSSARAKKLRRRLCSNRSDLTLRASLISCIWRIVGKPIMQNMNKIMPLNHVLTFIKAKLNTCEIIKDGKINDIIHMAEATECENIDQHSETLAIFKQLFAEANASTKKSLSSDCKKIGLALSAKINKDCKELMFSKSSPGGLVQISNQNLERSFGQLKNIEKKYLNCSPSTEIILTISKYNKLHTFLTEADFGEIRGSVKRLSESFRSDAREKKRSYTALRENRRKIVYRRHDIKVKLIALLSDSKNRPESLSRINSASEAILKYFNDDDQPIVLKLYTQVLCSVLSGIFYQTKQKALEHLEVLLP